MLAASKGYIDIVGILLTHGADPYACKPDTVSKEAHITGILSMSVHSVAPISTHLQQAPSWLVMTDLSD